MKRGARISGVQISRVPLYTAIVIVCVHVYFANYL